MPLPEDRQGTAPAAAGWPRRRALAMALGSVVGGAAVLAARPAAAAALGAGLGRHIGDYDVRRLEQR